MSELIPAIIVIGIAANVYWVLRTWSDNATRRKLAETRATIHRDLVAKFGSSQELVAYLGSDAGRELLGAVGDETPSPLRKILGAVQTGIVLLAVGIGFLSFSGASFLGREGEEGFLFLGGMATAVGVGFLASTAASWFLARRWGLLSRQDVAARRETLDGPAA